MTPSRLSLPLVLQLLSESPTHLKWRKHWAEDDTTGTCCVWTHVYILHALPNRSHTLDFVRKQRSLSYPMYVHTVLLFCTLGALVRGRAVVSPKRQAELMVSLVIDVLSCLYYFKHCHVCLVTITMLYAHKPNAGSSALKRIPRPTVMAWDKRVKYTNNNSSSCYATLISFLKAIEL